MTPLHPYSPGPSGGGMNGCQLAGLIACVAPAMNRSTTATFTNTMTLLTLADSLMPMTSSVVMIAMMITAGRLRSGEHTSELQSRLHLVCRLLLEKKKKIAHRKTSYGQ